MYTHMYIKRNIVFEARDIYITGYANRRTAIPTLIDPVALG
jgi:hypothetical protein